MFRAEAQALGALDDPHVVRLYEYVEWPAGAAIVMELVDGVTRGTSCRGTAGPRRRRPWWCCSGSPPGLAAPHARGAVHRDYKPRNVLINAYGASNAEKLVKFSV